MSETTTTPEAPAAAPEAKQETFSRDYVETLRQEAAKYRVEKNDAVEAAKAALIKDYEGKFAEKDTATATLQTDLSNRSVELARLKAVIAAGIHAEDILNVYELVQGTDETSISESVSRVKAIYGRAPSQVLATDPTQGSGGQVIPLNGDPILEALKKAVGVR